MVHTFEALGCYIAVDVNSGAVHVLDKMMYDLLREINGPMGEKCPDELKKKLKDYSSDALDECWDELLDLQKQGLLFEKDDYVNPAMAVIRNAPVKALCLNVSHDCNLRCKYCFASTGDFGMGRKTMSFETAKKAIDFVISRSGIRRNIEVDFFGGEPLMAMDTVKKTVEYARALEEEKGKHFRFTITTNGMLLNDENITYINEEMDNCVLSLDGRREVNDAHRPTAGGVGSYDVIVPKFKKLVDGRGDKDYYLRGTFTRDNLDFADDVMHLAELGQSVSVEPAVGKLDDPFAVREEDLPRVCAEYDKLARELLKNPEINFFHFNVDLAQGPCVIKRMRGCGAGCEYVCITPDGDIYPCHQFVGNEDYKMGNVYDDTFDMALSEKFAGMNIYTREECGDCWAKFYCSGGCSAANYNVNGDITRPSHVGCVMERKRLECAIAMRAIRAGLAEQPQ